MNTSPYSQHPDLNSFQGAILFHYNGKGLERYQIKSLHLPLNQEPFFTISPFNNLRIEQYLELKDCSTKDSLKPTKNIRTIKIQTLYEKLLANQKPQEDHKPVELQISAA